MSNRRWIELRTAAQRWRSLLTLLCGSPAIEIVRSSRRPPSRDGPFALRLFELPRQHVPARMPGTFQWGGVSSFRAALRVGEQFLAAEAGPFLNSGPMHAEQRNLNRRDNCLVASPMRHSPGTPFRRRSQRACRKRDVVATEGLTADDGDKLP